jgi:hypothetical protein
LNLDLAERAAGDAAFDPHRRFSDAEGNQHHLAVIDQQEFHVSPPEVLRRRGRGVREPLGRQDPTEAQELPESQLSGFQSARVVVHV